MKKLPKNISFTQIFFPKFHLNHTSSYNKKKKKNLIQEKTSKFSNVSKFRINIL